MLSARCIFSAILVQFGAISSPNCGSSINSVKTVLSTDQISLPVPHNVTGFNRPGTWGGVHLHDPSIVKGPDGKYYSFSTHGMMSTSRADSLNGPWQHLGPAFSGPSVISMQGRNDIWAPDVQHVNGTYYAYYSVSTFGSQKSAIGVATSKTLLPGSWKDHGAILTSGKEKGWPLNQTNAIDPNLFIDPKTGEPFLVYGSFWTNIWQYKLNPDLRSIDKSWTPKQLSYDPKGTNPEEGPYLHERGGWYYLWISHGICCGYNPKALPAAGTEYSIRVGRSRSAHGPFVDKRGVDMKNGGGTIVYGSHGGIYGPGGQGVLKDYNGRDVLYFHYVPTHVSYRDDDKLFGWVYINYEDGWPNLVY